MTKTARAWLLTFLTLPLLAGYILAQNTVRTIGGGGPNNLPALKSSMGNPSGVALDNLGNVYVADLYSARVLKIDKTGNLSVIAGNGARGYSGLGDGGPATAAYVAYLTGVAVDNFGNVFIADSTICTVREISAQTGNISTVVGSSYNCSYSGDGGAATSASLENLAGVALDGSGNIFLTDACVVRKVSAQTGTISVFAGTPPDANGTWRCGYSGDGGLATSAKIGLSNGVAVDNSGNVFIADIANCLIRAVSASTGIISTVAGAASCGYSGDGGPATSAQLNQPFALVVDSSGNIYIADTLNCLIRKVASSNVQISTVAGDYRVGCGYSGDGGLATSAQIGQPWGVGVDSQGDLFIADYDNSVIREVVASTARISTFAGVTLPNPYQAGQLIGLPAYSGDGYPAIDARLGFLNDTPWSAGLANDPSGNVLIADTFNSVIRKISAPTGIITTVAGNGLPGFSGDGGPATSAELFYPRDVAVDSAGNIFIVDSGNCLIRKITASTGIISTVAGTPPDASGNYYCDFSGDGGPATSAELNPIDLLSPAGGVAVDGSGNIFIADTGTNVIREVSGSTGIITTIAGIPTTVIYPGSGDGGPATGAFLNAPYAVAVDSSGNVFIADTGNFAVREVVAINGNIYSVAGNMGLGRGFSGDGGPAEAAQIGYVFGLFLDPAGNLFIPDADHCVIREVSSSTGNISSVAGTPNPSGIYYCGYAGDDGPALSAIFDNPGAAGTNASGELVVLDNIRVRAVADLVQESGGGAVAFPSPLVFTPTPVGASSALSVVLSNRGSSQDNVSTVTISGTNASDFSETDNCVGHSLAAGGGSCVISVKFSPSVAGTDSALLTMNNSASTQTVNLSGAGSDFSLGAASNGSTSATVTAGQSANYNLQVNSVSGFAGTVTLACSGAPAQSTCSVSAGVNVIAGSPAPFTLTVSTTAPTAATSGATLGLFPRPLSFPATMPLVTLLFLLGIMPLAAHAARRRVWALLAGSLCVAVVLSGCGGGSSGGGGGGGGGGNGGTPHGTYTVTVAGTQQGLSRSLQLTLNVN